jgi:uncharacterized protein DUF29
VRDLYGTDILLWAEHQADLAPPTAGELVNAMLRQLADVAEEIEDVGRTQLHTVELLLVQALRHIPKAEAWRLSRAAPSWRADAIHFRRQAGRRFVPSMRQRIDVASLYADALAGLPETMGDQPPLSIQTEMPTLDELLSDLD